MRTSTIAWICVILLVLAAGGYYAWSVNFPPYNPLHDEVPPNGFVPNGAAGINGSQNQGNLGGADTGTPQQPMADGAEGTVIGGNVALGVQKSETLGTYLIAYNGMTLYTFIKDRSGTSTCYAQCAEMWPPYLVGAEDNIHNVKLGVDGNKADTIIRADGKIQATYKGLPLYFYKEDAASGDTKGQNINNAWLVVKP